MATATQTQLKRHPIRGAIYGLLTGIGAAVYLVIFGITPFSVTTMIVVVAASLVIGAFWGVLAPAKKPKDMSDGGGATFARVHDDDEAAPTYEATFAPAPAPAPEPELAPMSDDGAFGAESPPEAPDDPPTPV